MTDEPIEGVHFISVLKPNVLVDATTVKDAQAAREYDWSPYIVSI